MDSRKKLYRQVTFKKHGITNAVVALLVEIIKPDHPMNPWAIGVRKRNRLAINILLSTGMRASELLNLRIDAFDYGQNTVFVQHVKQKCAKLSRWKGRTIPMDHTIIAESMDYINTDRKKYPGTGGHNYLLTSAKDGSPLTNNSLCDIFVALRRKNPDVPSDFGPISCRHSWNNRFSVLCDQQDIDRETEKMIRCRFMGWPIDNKIAEAYSKRERQHSALKFLDEPGAHRTESMTEYYLSYDPSDI